MSLPAPVNTTPPSKADPPPRPLTSDDYIRLGIDLTLALRISMRLTNIKPMDWPTRIIAALRRGAASDHFSELVSLAATQLTLPNLYGPSIGPIAAIELELMTHGRSAFIAFRNHLAREAVYIEAMAREKRNAEREAAALIAIATDSNAKETP